MAANRVRLRKLGDGAAVVLLLEPVQGDGARGLAAAAWHGGCLAAVGAHAGRSAGVRPARRDLAAGAGASAAGTAAAPGTRARHASADADADRRSCTGRRA